MLVLFFNDFFTHFVQSGYTMTSAGKQVRVRSPDSSSEALTEIDVEGLVELTVTWEDYPSSRELGVHADTTRPILEVNGLPQLPPMQKAFRDYMNPPAPWPRLPRTRHYDQLPVRRGQQRSISVME